MIKKTLLAVSILAVSGAAFAQAPSYNYFGLGYASTEFDVGGADVDVTGFNLSASYEFTDRLFGSVDYASGSTNDLGLDYDDSIFGLGVGYILTETNTTNTYIGLAYGKGNVEENNLLGVDEDVTVMGVTAGIRSNYSENLELSASITAAQTEIANTDDESISIGVGADYFFNPTTSLGVSISNNEGDNTLGLNLRIFY